MAYHDCRMINMWRTPVEPMHAFVARMQSLEGQDGILSVSFGHGFPWGDVEDVGAKMLVIADGDAGQGAGAGRRSSAREFWDMRERTVDAARHDRRGDRCGACRAGEAARSCFADVADNAGGGAPSDNTAILRRLVDRGVQGAVIGCFWDPQAVQFCLEAGRGRRLHAADRRQMRRRLGRPGRSARHGARRWRRTMRRPASAAAAPSTARAPGCMRTASTSC